MYSLFSVWLFPTCLMRLMSIFFIITFSRVRQAIPLSAINGKFRLSETSLSQKSFFDFRTWGSVFYEQLSRFTSASFIQPRKHYNLMSAVLGYVQSLSLTTSCSSWWPCRTRSQKIPFFQVMKGGTIRYQILRLLLSVCQGDHLKSLRTTRALEWKSQILQLESSCRFKRIRRTRSCGDDAFLIRLKRFLFQYKFRNIWRSINNDSGTY